jgi:predicted MFS family arabinose efflux permease
VALAAPAALSLVAVLFPGGRERARALGVWGGLGALGAVAGLLLSGLLTGMVSWRWVFLTNLPIAVVALVLLPRLVDESHAPGGRLDLAGTVLATGGLVAVVAGLLAASSRSWGDPGVLGPQLGGLAALAAFALVERRAPDPLLPPQFFASPVRSIAALSMTLMTGAMAAMFLLLSLYMSTVMNYSPLSVGIAYLPFCAVLVVALAASAPLVTRHGHRPAACVAFALAAAGLLLLSRVPAYDAGALDLVPAVLLVALGLGPGLPALQGAALHDATAADAGMAASVIACVQQLGARSRAGGPDHARVPASGLGQLRRHP